MKAEHKVTEIRNEEQVITAKLNRDIATASATKLALIAKLEEASDFRDASRELKWLEDKALQFEVAALSALALHIAKEQGIGIHYAVGAVIEDCMRALERRSKHERFSLRSGEQRAQGGQ